MAESEGILEGYRAMVVEGLAAFGKPVSECVWRLLG
jgi:hypothetical protein